MITLETPRLFLREFLPEDAEAMFILNSDPEVIKYTGDVAFATVEESAALIRNYDQYRKYRSGRLAVIIKETGETAGWCGLKYHAHNGETDLGYRLMRKFWNRGYATEASAECLRYGFDILKLDTIIACASKENIGSIRVMQKLGMLYWKEDMAEGQPSVFYRIENPHP